MDLIDKIREIATRVEKQKDLIQTEEATKNAFIMPFISALGYDVFNPLEVIPEFTADVGTKKGEKVDYAIKKDDKIIFLMECKWNGVDLQKEHTSQLYRYFSTSESRFAILTNGIIYRFFSDIDESNKMDSKPFFEFNILHFEAHHIEELKKFAKQAFSLDDILTTASTLKYAGEVKKILEAELDSPSEAFVRFFASQAYDGRLTQPVIKQFSRIVKEARDQFINEKINDRLKSALKANVEPLQEENEINDVLSNEIVTTDEEKEGYNIIKAVLRNKVDINRIVLRDTKSYCGILLDDNNRKPICRLHFNNTKKYLGLVTNKKEERIPIDNLNEIFMHSAKLESAVTQYDIQ